MPKHTHLKGANGSTLEAKICLEVLCNFTHKTLEWQLPDQQLGRLLVSSNFSKGHGTWPTRK
jgi:histone H3